MVSTISHSCSVSQMFSQSKIHPWIQIGRIPSLIIAVQALKAGQAPVGVAWQRGSRAWRFTICATPGSAQTRVPDLDTSLAISGSKTLAACHTEQDRRQNAHPAAGTTAGASLPTHPVVSLCLLAAHNMHKVTPLQLSRLNVMLCTETGFRDSRLRGEARIYVQKGPFFFFLVVWRTQTATL